MVTPLCHVLALKDVVLAYSHEDGKGRAEMGPSNSTWVLDQAAPEAGLLMHLSASMTQ